MRFSFLSGRDPFELFRNGEEEGFDFFFKAYYKSLVFFTRRYVTDLTIAEDLVGDVFVKVWDKRAQLDSAEGLKSYLYRSTYNAAIRWLERETKRDKIEHRFMYEQGANTPEPAYIENLVRTETIRQMRDAIQTLPGQCRKVFEKLFIEGKSIRETAADLQLSISNVKNQKARGLKLLRNKLGGNHPLLLVFFLN